VSGISGRTDLLDYISSVECSEAAGKYIRFGSNQFSSVVSVQFEPVEYGNEVGGQMHTTIQSWNKNDQSKTCS
jgi:hypothetical protein